MKAPQLNAKYQALGNDSRYFVVTGGRGSGKSFAVGSFLALLTMEQGHKILFTRYTMRSAHISVIPEFLEKIELLGLQDIFHVTKDEIINTATGSSIIFRGLKTSSGDATAQLKSLQGVTTWVLDEAEELVDESTFDKIDLSIRAKDIQNRVILILNPTTKEHWIYNRFFLQNKIAEGSNIITNNTTYIHTTYLDNEKHLSKSFLEQVERIKTSNPKKYEHQILGGWMNKAEGVVFDNWEVGEYKDCDLFCFGQDFGFSIDPTTLIQVAVDNDKGLIYLRECFYEPKLTTTQIYELDKRHTSSSFIIADSAEPRLINELRQRGINIREAIKGVGSVSAGIALMQDYRIIIDHNSVNLIKEFNNYCWLDKTGKTMPIDDYNHGIDAARYAISFLLKNRNKGKYTLR